MNKSQSGPDFLPDQLDDGYIDKTFSLEKGDFLLLEHCKKLNLAFTFASPQIFQEAEGSKIKNIELLNHREEFKIIGKYQLS